MDTDKENQQQQLVRNKTTLEKSAAPRTPFSTVNRQSAYMTDASSVSEKPSGQGLNKPRGKRHSWADGYHNSKSSYKTAQHDSFTPLRTRETIKKQITESACHGAEGQGTQHSVANEEDIGGPPLSCTLPPSPVVYLPSKDVSMQCHPTGSVSCPDMFSSKYNQALSHISVDGSDGGTTMSGASEMEMKADNETHTAENIVEQADGHVESPGEDENACSTVSEFHELASSDAVPASCTAETGMPAISEVVLEDSSCVEERTKQDEAKAEDVQPPATDLSTGIEEDTDAAVQSVLDELVSGVFDAVAKSLSPSSPEQFLVGQLADESVASVDYEAAEDRTFDMETCLPVSDNSPYMAEYSRFVASYIKESKQITAELISKELASVSSGDQSSNLPSSASGASSETDVTSSSLMSDVDTDQNSFNTAGRACEKVVLDSLGSFLYDADDSMSSHDISTQNEGYTGGETPRSRRFKSPGFVRSSMSRFDLTRESDGVPSPWKSQSEESVDQNESLSMSISQQRVVYFTSPSATSPTTLALQTSLTEESEVMTEAVGSDSIGFSPNIIPAQGQEVCDEVTYSADDDTVTQGVHVMSVAQSPLPQTMRDSQTATADVETADADVMTLSVDVNSVALSPFAVPTSERGVNVDTMALGVNMSSIGLSPIPVAAHEKQTETADLMQTVEVDTMTLGIPTNDVALSPVTVAVKDNNTMTIGPERAEVAMETDMVECLNTSVLATTEMSHKTTMTDSGGSCNAHTSMTPLKALAKQGRRLTSDDIRKQHPRTLANQLETLTVCNSRLESELKSAQEEQSQLKAALKQAKVSEAGIRKELAAAELLKEKEWTEKEHQYQEKVQKLEQQVAEHVGYISTLEQETAELRESLEVATRRHAQSVMELEAKCQAVEEHRCQAAHQYERELEDLRLAQETNTYKRQFELAQQLVREREAELTELRAVFVDLQDTAQRQEQVNEAFQGIHNKVMALAKENKQLKDALHKQRMLSQEERSCQNVHLSVLEEENKSLVQETDNLKQTMELNNSTLSEVEKLYAGASSDLLTATGQVIQLNTELFGARKAMQELLLTKEGLAKRANELQDELDVVRQEHATLTDTLTQAQEQLEQQTKACQDLEKLNAKIKRIYEEKFENLELGIENLQRTLDNRELDIDNLEKDLYECRNIIVEQRYKIDGLESELRQAREEASKKQSNDDDIQFYKESNAFLEAERSLYVESLRDLEEKLKMASLEVSRQQQMASDAQCLVTQLEREKGKLQSQLTQTQNRLKQSSHALAVSEAEQARVESVAVAAASELLQKMQTVLSGLKKKIGMQEMPQASAPGYRRRSQMTSAKHKRNVRKSFVSKILGAAYTSSPVKLSPENRPAAAEPDHKHRNQSEADKHNTSDMAGVMNASGDATSTGASLFAVLDSLSPDKVEARENHQERAAMDGSSFKGMGLSASDLAIAYSLNREDVNISAPGSAQKSFVGHSRPGPAFTGPVPRLAPSQSSAFTAVPSLATPSSSRLNTSLPPPPTHPPTSAVAKIRTLPRTDRRSAPVGPTLPPADPGTGEDILSGTRGGFLTCILSLEATFMDISRLASILDRATQLSLQDLKEENELLRERTIILEDEVDRTREEVERSRQESINFESTIGQLQESNRQMAERLMTLTDHKFEVKRLSGEVKRLEGEVDTQRREKEVLASELETLLKRLETSSSSEGGTVQARCVRDIIALKKKNQNLLSQLVDQKEHYEELGHKATRRMRVLEDNWKKAEEEVYRFDELVENIRRVAESRASPPSSCMHRILQLINGGINSSQV